MDPAAGAPTGATNTWMIIEAGRGTVTVQTASGLWVTWGPAHTSYLFEQGNSLDAKPNTLNKRK